MLYDAYAQYYADPSFVNAEALWDCILKYDFTESLDGLVELRKRIPPQPHLADFVFHSNGSTGQPRHFQFGPHCGYWLRQIEDIVKYRRTNRFVYLANSITTHDRHLRFGELPADYNSFPYAASVRFDYSDAVPFLIDKLQNIGEFGLDTSPNNWLYLFSNNKFVNFLCRSRLTSALSTCWELICKDPPFGIHLNDNMVNWSTCMNFYTCSHRTKHFLPTFVPTKFGIINLLNLSQPAMWPLDDLMVIRHPVLVCPCGAAYQHFRFTPHVTHTIRSSSGQIVHPQELAKQLMSCYINLQFVQLGQTVDVLFIVDGDMLDTSIISEYFATYGLKTNFLRNKYFKIVSKLPVFWQTTQLVSYRTHRVDTKVG
jgi:hypothetical protein